MSEKEIKLLIESAFANTPAPGNNFSDISATMDDEGIVEYFRGTTWRGHRVQDLRCHSAALSFFTDKAFRYWLPAFMLAELENPDAADSIAEGIALHLSDANLADARLKQFSQSELKALVAFLNECAMKYDDGTRSAQFRKAERAVNSQILDAH